MDNASQRDKYEKLLKEEIFSGIAEKKVSGYKRIQLFRRPLDNDEVEFVTIMWFDSWDAVKQFAGEDCERAYVPAAAQEVLVRFDERSQHNEIRESLEYWKLCPIRTITQIGCLQAPAANFGESIFYALG